MDLLRYSLFDPFPEICAWTTPREGGVSLPPYDNFNLSYNVGDDPHHVFKNQQLLHSALAPTIGPTTWIELNQVHGTHVVWIDSLPDPSGDFDRRIIQQTDAVITRLPGVYLTISHADCQAALIYDPVEKVIAAVHAGWKGLVAGIYQKVIQELLTHGSRAENLRIAISPSLGPCCSEFKNWQSELGDLGLLCRVEGSQDLRFNLVQLAEYFFQSFGVLQKFVQHFDMCTRCGGRRGGTGSRGIPSFFSFRRSHQTGRHLSGICLQNN